MQTGLLCTLCFWPSSRAPRISENLGMSLNQSPLGHTTFSLPFSRFYSLLPLSPEFSGKSSGNLSTLTCSRLLTVKRPCFVDTQTPAHWHPKQWYQNFGLNLRNFQVSNGTVFFHFSEPVFSRWTFRKLPFHLLLNRKFRNFLPNGSRPRFSPFRFLGAKLVQFHLSTENSI